MKIGGGAIGRSEVYLLRQKEHQVVAGFGTQFLAKLRYVRPLLVVGDVQSRRTIYLTDAYHLFATAGGGGGGKQQQRRYCNCISCAPCACTCYGDIYVEREKTGNPLSGCVDHGYLPLLVASVPRQRLLKKEEMGYGGTQRPV